MHKKKIAFSVLLLFCSIVVVAQTKAIVGKVTSSQKNAPVSGATVQLKKSNTLKKTGTDGSFSIDVPQNSSGILVVTNVGGT